MVLFAFLVSVVFGVLSPHNPRQSVLYGVKVFGMFVGVALALAVVMYFVP